MKLSEHIERLVKIRSGGKWIDEPIMNIVGYLGNVDDALEGVDDNQLAQYAYEILNILTEYVTDKYIVQNNQHKILDANGKYLENRDVERRIKSDRNTIEAFENILSRTYNVDTDAAFKLCAKIKDDLECENFTLMAEYARVEVSPNKSKIKTFFKKLRQETSLPKHYSDDFINSEF